MLLCLDLSYDFAAAVFVPVLRKVVTFCLQVDSSSAASITRNLVQPIAATPDSKMSYMERLANRPKDEVRPHVTPIHVDLRLLFRVAWSKL